MLLRKALVIGLLAVASASLSHGEPFTDGVAAYEQEDYAAAASLWRPLAEQGNARAQASLGFLYLHGQGVPLDSVEAARWLQLAAAQGDALAQGSLGFLYAYGVGVPRDLVRAHAWFSLAAAHADGALQRLFIADLDRVARLMSAEQIAAAQRLQEALDAETGLRVTRGR
jgi:TPR repeat protein